ncbi:hypothetical protein FCIRC_12543 [Fusarium circinatum]|uniref:Uncharacterized protein n=1 Tax=Fusarium circinatum TaxID=48490 RepID=A0A8H5WGR2_FUSCI|nr:hypothetical protein FCIRC_12543 [Fusarium circinatum]
MKPLLVGLGSMVLVASAAPILPDSPSPLVAAADGLTLDKRAELAVTSGQTLSGDALEKRGNRLMNIPNHAGTAIQNIGTVIVKAIIGAAGDLVFQITNNGRNTLKVSFRERGTMLDAANLNVAAQHTVSYNPRGAINPGDVISINTQR